MPVTFKIEKILSLRRKPTIARMFSSAGPEQYLLIRLINHGQDFFISEKSFLGGVKLTKYLDVPRIVTDNGELETDIYSVKIEDPAEISKLKEEMIVELTPGDRLLCLEPWHFVDHELTGQLETEMNWNHVLGKKEFKTIARRQDNDDVLFEVFNADFKYAKVHLTWSQKRITDPSLPATKTYKTWQEVYEQLMIPDNKDWE